MIQPRFTFTSLSKSSSEDCFVNREDVIDIVDRMLERSAKSASPGNAHVLNVYGVGGIGKTRLRKHLSKRCEKTTGNPLIAFNLDFRVPEDRSVGEGILTLVDSCKCDESIHFPLFEHVYAAYFKKRHPANSYDRERNRLSERFGIGIDIISILDGGITKAATGIIDTSRDVFFKARLKAEIKDDLDNFDEYSAEELETRLPAYLKLDVARFLSKHPTHQTLFFIDTLEAINEYETRDFKRIENMRWIQDLIAHFTDSLFIVFSRDRIRWGEEWSHSITFKRLEPLDDEYSQKYLELKGFAPKECPRIISESKGHPLYLSLAAEAYRAGKGFSTHDPNAVKSVLELPREDIINRFLYYLQSEEAETLKVLSHANFFTYDLFKHVVSSFETGFPLTLFDSFVEHSFVSEESERYFIQEIVRNAVAKTVEKNLSKRINSCIADYYNERFAHTRDREDYFQLIYHKIQSTDSACFLTWFAETALPYLQNMQIAGEQRYVSDLLHMTLEHIDSQTLPPAIFSVYTDIIHLGGDYAQAVSLIDGYLDSRQSVDEAGAFSYHNLRVRSLHHRMFYDNANELLVQAHKLFDSLRNELDRATAAELMFLIGGNLSPLAGSFDQARYWLEKTADHVSKHNLADFEKRIDRKMADLALVAGAESEAREILAKYRYLANRPDQELSRYELYLLGSCGEYLRMIGNVSESQTAFVRMRTVSHAKGLVGWEAHANLALANLLADKPSEKPLTLCSNALATYIRTESFWGITNAWIVATRISPNDGIALFEQASLTKESIIDLCTDKGYQYQLGFLSDEANPKYRILFL